MINQQETGRQQKTCKAKIVINGVLIVLTGMHIGGNKDTSSIGAVDAPVIRDICTHEPLIPGSSLKGKLRTLLVKARTSGYLLRAIEEDDEVVQRLFGAGGKVSRAARLQFWDLFITEESRQRFSNLETDTYLGEIKYENEIKRITAAANPRQIERVPAGMKFQFKLVYNMESEEEAAEDMKVLAEGLRLLELDYLGGHGSRGYGRVKMEGLSARIVGAEPTVDDATINAILATVHGETL
ncbi:type III-A CRISPR-associated RAMP protein Csm3 [Colibacter massiliensis]|uniref:type III-A CRISPR-associated RAMP protein Csm3 n=1 Tax=Colibacter massiliensis TaxID=1852379 RepID=UPI00266C1803|nr:type III-A CRISPR-associated RAMP protein Csm3 [Colibacter massiliensis]